MHTASQLLPGHEHEHEQQRQRELQRKDVQLEMKDQQQRKGRHQKSDGQGHQSLHQRDVHHSVSQQQQQQDQNAQHQGPPSKYLTDLSDAKNSKQFVKNEVTKYGQSVQISPHHSLLVGDFHPLTPLKAAIPISQNDNLSVFTTISATTPLQTSAPAPLEVSASMPASALLIERDRTLRRVSDPCLLKEIREVRTIQLRFHFTTLYCQDY